MSWLADASANKIVKSYIKDFVDISGNFKVRHAVSGTVVDNGPVAWNQLGADIDGEFVGDNFGSSISLSDDGTIVAIGARYNDDNGSNAGHVRVYEYSGGSWSQLGADIDGEATGDRSGWRLALSSDGMRLAIGGLYNDANGSNAGHVRVYEYSGGSWSQLGADIDGEAAGDQLGDSVSLSSDGTIVAIGASRNDGNGSNSGHVRVYEYSGGSWSQLGADIDGEAADDQSGFSVSLSSDGTIIAIGGYNNGDAGDGAGQARVYKYVNSAWTQIGQDIDGEAAGDWSGYSLSLSSDGTRLAIGAFYNDGNGSDSGHVRVYEYSGGSWNQVGADIDGEAADDISGWSVSLSGDGTIVAIGARFNDGNGADAGHARVYEYSGGSWSQVGGDIDGEAAGDQSGYKVSLSEDGMTLAVSSMLNDATAADAGHVRVYNKTGGLVTTPGSETIPMDVSGGIVSFLKAETDPVVVDAVPYSTTQLGQDLVGAIGDGMGTDVAMNEDGTMMVVGALGVKANNGSSLTGAAYVYEDVNGTWTLKGSEIKPFPTATTDRRFGESVGINNTGNTIVVGALSGAYNYSSSDRASISAWEYSEDTSDWVQKGSIKYADAVLDDFSMVAINKTGDMIAGSAPRGGYVRVYQYTNNDWTQIGNFSITSYTGYAGRYRGSITFCDDIPGRFAFGDAGSGDSVQVHDYDFDNSTWTQVGSTITVTMASANIEDGGFGSSVSFSKDGTLLAVGAIDGGLDGTEDGDARVFQYNSGTSAWEQLGDTLHKDDDRGEGAHGCIVKLDHTGTLLAVANYFYEPGGSLNRAGAIFIYKYRNGAWDEVILEQHTDNTNQYWGDGMTLSKDGTRFAGSTVNGDVNGKNDGLARAFTITGNEATTTLGTTVQTMKIEDGTVDISGTTWINQGQSGASIATSNQGAFIVESAGTSSSNSVVYVETAGQTQAFSIRENGDLYSANALQHSSDDRRKTNEQYITNATETIQKLSPQIYTKLNDLVQNGGTGTKTESGLIAQEIYYNAPELRHLVHIEDEYGNKLTPQEYDLSGNDIQNDPDYTALGWGNKSAYVDYTGLIPYLIKSNQEQQAMIDNKKQALLDQKKTLEEDVRARIASLESK